MKLLETRRGRVIGVAISLACASAGFLALGAKRLEGGAAVAVQVMNTPLPVETETAKRDVYESLAFISGATTVFTTPNIPANKKLILDFVSGYCSVAPGDDIDTVNVATVLPGTTTFGAYHYFTPVFIGTRGGSNQYGITQQTHIVASPGTAMIVDAELNGSSSCAISLTGSLINP